MSGGSTVRFGDPFYFAVNECNNDGTIDRFDVDGHPGIFADEAMAIEEMSEGIEEHGGCGIVFYCVPVVRVDHVPRVKVKRLKARSEHPSEGWDL